jgi:hypothetical protein
MNQLSSTVKDARGYVSLLALTGVVLSALGGFLLGAVESDGMALAGFGIAGLGGVMLTIATVAWGVRLGMESVERL